MNLEMVGNTLCFSGELSEKSDMNVFRCAILDQKSLGKEPVAIDFNKVDRGNSVGLMHMLEVLRDCDAKVCFEHTPIWLVEQFNMLEEFSRLPISVLSFGARFYSAKADDFVIRVLTAGKDFPLLDSYEGFDLRVYSQDGELLEPDFEVCEYFDFLTRFVCGAKLQSEVREA